MPQSLDSVAEALTAFMRILSMAKESLKKIFIRGKYDEYPDDKEMHCSARLAEMLNQYSDELQGKGKSKVKRISHTPVEFVNRVWGYIEGVVVSVIVQHTDSYPRAAHNLIAKMREQSVDRVMEIVEMQKLTDCTCNPAYLAAWNTLMLNQSKFIEIIENNCLPSVMTIEGYG
ncbi:hypothetical protein Ancab_000511 [Ancistrocladus abbreviatus]